MPNRKQTQGLLANLILAVVCGLIPATVAWGIHLLKNTMSDIQIGDHVETTLSNGQVRRMTVPNQQVADEANKLVATGRWTKSTETSPEPTNPTNPMKNIESAAEFQSEVLESKKPVIVDFWAAWCGPCKMLKPVIEATSAELEGVGKVVLVDADTQAGLVSQYGIRALPTLLIFHNGEIKDTTVGANITKESLVEKVKALASAE